MLTYYRVLLALFPKPEIVWTAYQYMANLTVNYTNGLRFFRAH